MASCKNSGCRLFVSWTESLGALLEEQKNEDGSSPDEGVPEESAGF